MLRDMRSRFTFDTAKAREGKCLFWKKSVS